MHIIIYGLLIVTFFYMCNIWTCCFHSVETKKKCFLPSDIEGSVMGVMFSWQDLEVLKRSNWSRAIEAAEIRVISCFSQEVVQAIKKQRKEKTCYHHISIVIQQILTMWPSEYNPDIICLNKTSWSPILSLAVPGQLKQYSFTSIFVLFSFYL